jgi:hypothetical protein
MFANILFLLLLLLPDLLFAFVVFAEEVVGDEEVEAAAELVDALLLLCDLVSLLLLLPPLPPPPDAPDVPPELEEFFSFLSLIILLHSEDFFPTFSLILTNLIFHLLKKEIGRVYQCFFYIYSSLIFFCILFHCFVFLHHFLSLRK